MTPEFNPAAPPTPSTPVTDAPSLAPVTGEQPHGSPAAPIVPAPAADAPVPPAAVVPAPAATGPAPSDAPKPASSTQKVGDVVTFEDYDYVTETTTTRHALVVGTNTVAVTRDGKDEDVPALTVVFLGEGVTLPADAFTI